MKRILRLCLLLVIVFPFFTDASQPITVSLAGHWQAHDGNDLQFSGIDSRVSPNWRALQVPANWYTAGWDHQGVLWYRRAVSLPPRQPNQMATLVFEGVDYHSDVWFNGQNLGQHEGYFQRFSLDITPVWQTENQLVVRVDSPREEPQTVWPLHKKLMKGILNQHDTRPGGAWSSQGQDANSGGIWAPVQWHISRGAVIDNLILRPDWRQGLDHPYLQAQIVYRAQAPATVVLNLNAAPANFSGRSFRLQQRVELIATGSVPQQLTVMLPMETARLWWPAGYGAPNLYQVTATLSDSQGVMDRYVSRTGLRKAEIQANNAGWLINGKRLFIKGTNYIGSPWLSTMNTERYRRDFALLLGMNANTIRVHGHVADRALYQVADEMGLMLWQDVPLQWAYDDSPAFAENAVRQTREMLAQRGNSPAIIVWGGQNEPPWNSPWMKQRFPDWNEQLNRRLTTQVAQALAGDSSRIVHAFSAVEEHYWAGWYFGTLVDFLKTAKTAVVSEFGAQALPRLSTLKTIIPENDRWPSKSDLSDPKWKRWTYHNFQPLQTFKFAHVLRGNTLPEFIYNTQTYQASLIQLAAESYRRQRYQPVNALFHFMFAETWPSINWGVVDYLRHPKKGYFALQRAFQPLLPSIEPMSLHWQKNKPGQINFWVINDRWQGYSELTLHWEIRSGEYMRIRGAKMLDVEPDSGIKIEEVPVTPTQSGLLEVRAWLTNRHGEILSRNAWQTDVWL